MRVGSDLERLQKVLTSYRIIAGQNVARQNESDVPTEFIVRNKINPSLITETWLKESVPDSVINIPGFTLLRRVRSSQIHGGVCAYIRETHYKYERLDDLNCCDDHECLWIYLRPTRLPRGLTCIITSVIYHPPGAVESYCWIIFFIRLL